MSGAWEWTPSVLVGTLHTDVTTIAWAAGLRNLIIPRGGFLPVTGMPYCHARNAIVQHALDAGVDYVFFLDSDVIPPRDTVLRLLAHKLPVVSGIYHRRSHPFGLPVLIKNGTWVQQYPSTGLIDVDLVGAGCLLISTDFLRQMPPIRPELGKHWFSWQVDQPQDKSNPGWNLSEDFSWCRWVREKMGVPIKVDCSVICKHVGYSEYGYNSVQPLNHQWAA